MDTLLPVIIGLLAGIILVVSFAILLPVRSLEKPQLSEYVELKEVVLPLDVTADSTGLYVAGSTWSVVGEKLTGKVDAFVSKYGLAGNHLWTQQFGEPESISEVRAVASDSSSVYVAGDVRHDPLGSNQRLDDAYIGKYRNDGKLLWIKQIKSNDTDSAEGVAIDTTGVYIVGNTSGDLDGRNMGQVDIFIRKYDSAGDILWSKQIGTADQDYTQGVATDTTGVYIVGGTDGELRSVRTGILDINIMKFDHDGNELWSHQFGYIDRRSEARAVATDGSGVYLVGYSEYFSEDSFTGNVTEIIRKYDRYGAELWKNEIQLNYTSFAPLGVTKYSSGIYVASQFSDDRIPDPIYGSLVGSIIQKFSQDGTMIWQESFVPSENIGLALNIGSGSRVHLIVSGGESEGFSGKPKILLVTDRNTSLEPQGKIITEVHYAGEVVSDNPNFVYTGDLGPDGTWTFVCMPSEWIEDNKKYVCTEDHRLSVSLDSRLILRSVSINATYSGWMDSSSIEVYNEGTASNTVISIEAHDFGAIFAEDISPSPALVPANGLLTITFDASDMSIGPPDVGTTITFTIVTDSGQEYTATTVLE